jgi:hypothetical protein
MHVNGVPRECLEDEFIRTLDGGSGAFFSVVS